MIRIMPKCQCIAAGIILALLFNSIGALFIASKMLSHAQTFANEDAALICTGSAFKWISLTTYNQTGELEFVEPPENAPSDVKEIKCSYAYVADTHSNEYLFATTTEFAIPSASYTAIHYFRAIYPTSRHQLSHTRAPPTFT